MSTQAPPSPPCPQCGNAVDPDGSFCRNCGIALLSAAQRRREDAYIEAKAKEILSTKLVSEESLVRELANKVERDVWKRFWGYAALIGLLLFFDTDPSPISSRMRNAVWIPSSRTQRTGDLGERELLDGFGARHCSRSEEEADFSFHGGESKWCPARILRHTARLTAYRKTGFTR
jgi:predicted nucleic acid-binding Zn ribbon protein